MEFECPILPNAHLAFDVDGHIITKHPALPVGLFIILFEAGSTPLLTLLLQGLAIAFRSDDHSRHLENDGTIIQLVGQFQLPMRTDFRLPVLVGLNVIFARSSCSDLPISVSHCRIAL